jgi:hypothetical protein
MVPRATQAPIQAIENIVYAMYYPASPGPSGLSTGAKAGIGAGVGVVGLALIALAIFFLLRRRHREPRPESDPGQKPDPHLSGSTFASPGPASPNMQQEPTIPYIETQHQGIEHYPHSYAGSNSGMPTRGYMPTENVVPPLPANYRHPGNIAAVPLGGYLPQDDPENGPRPAYQNWPPIREQHWQTAQGIHVSPPTSTASPPPDSRYGGTDGYSSPGSQTGLRPSELQAGQGWTGTGETPELQGGQAQARWELQGGRS